MAAFVTVASRSIRIPLEAAARHDLVHVSTFLRAGGTLSLERARFGRTELSLRPDAWFCLSAFEQLLMHGAEIKKTVGGFDISLASGRIFELRSERLLPAALVVLHERFVADEYAELKVAGSVVVDIGAHIGDSAVYFADKGAVHVYAFEPFHEPFATAMMAIRRNLLDGRVTVVPRGVGPWGGRGIGLYDPTRSHASRGSVGDSIHQPLHGPTLGSAQEFELVSLPSVLDMAREQYPGRPLVLKMDCEGCEFQVFEGDRVLNSLRAVTSILIEVHHKDRRAHECLRSKLEDCGFTVVVVVAKGTGVMSLLLATRNESGESVQTHNQT